MTTYGIWLSYTGAARFALAAALLLVAGLLGWLGLRLRAPIRVTPPGRVVLAFLLLIWVLAALTTGVAAAADLAQERQVGLQHALPANPIAPVTLSAAVGLLVLLLVTTRGGWWTALLTATVGAAAAPMVFELPFDLIVLTRTFPPVPPHPELYRALFFLPLLVVEVTTLALLTRPPAFRVNRAALAFLAWMFTVFAAWALVGFAYPSTPLPIAANIASKLLAFAAVASLLLPARTPAPSETNASARASRT